MATQTLPLDVPEDLVTLVGSPEQAALKAKEAVVMELLREAQIGQSRAAEWLGLTRADVLDLMVKYQVPSGPLTEAEVAEELEAAQRYLRDQRRGGDQQQ